MKKYTTLEDYLAELPQDTKETIVGIKKLFLKAVPETEEIFNSNYIRYSIVKGSTAMQQFMVTGYTNHVGFYPPALVMTHFENDIKDYKTGKGTLQFKNNAPLPDKLIIQMVQQLKHALLEKEK